MERDVHRTPTERVRLAHLAAEAVAVTGGVTATAGPAGLWRTQDGERAIPGVVAIALPEGRFEIALHLEALWPPEPFEVVAGSVRDRLQRLARTAGLGDRLGPVEVAFHDVRAPLADEGLR